MPITDPARLNALQESVIGAAFETSNTLGVGFLEKVYERALVHELSLQGLKAENQAPISITYKGHRIGDYLADILVEESLLIEIKCVDDFASEHMAQCINYLRATGLKLALLINFKKSKVEWKRIVNNF